MTPKAKPTETQCVVLGMDPLARDRIIAEKERIAYLANKKRNPKKHRGKRTKHRGKRTPAEKKSFINEDNVFKQAFKKGSKKT